MEETNLPKVEVKADLTKTIENAYDDTLKKPLKSSSKVLSTVFDFFHNTILYPMQKYNLYAESKLENYSRELQEKARSIPEENLVTPRVNILGPTFDGLKYNLDEDYVKEMFTNILISDMDKTKRNKVNVAFIYMVNQLNNSDAKLLAQLNEFKTSQIAIIKLNYRKADGGFSYISNDLIASYNNNFMVLKAVNIENLSRLKLLDVTFEEYFTNKSIYLDIFNLIKPNISFTLPHDAIKLDYTYGLLKITDLGKDFIDICLS